MVAGHKLAWTSPRMTQMLCRLLRLQLLFSLHFHKFSSRPVSINAGGKSHDSSRDFSNFWLIP